MTKLSDCVGKSNLMALKQVLGKVWGLIHLFVEFEGALPNLPFLCYLPLFQPHFSCFFLLTWFPTHTSDSGRGGGTLPCVLSCHQGFCSAFRYFKPLDAFSSKVGVASVPEELKDGVMRSEQYSDLGTAASS